MNSLIAILLFTGFAIVVGYTLASCFGKISRIEQIGLAFFLGSGGTTYIWFLLFRLGLPLTLSTLLLAGLLILIFGQILSHFWGGAYAPVQIQKIKLLDKWMIGLIGVGLLLLFLIGSYNSITAWDSMALYDFRAHAIFLNHDLRDLTNSSYYLSYPLYVSLVHSAIYFLGGVNPQGIHAMLFAAFLAVIFGRVYSWTNLRFALIAVLLHLLSFDLLTHATIAYANLPYVSFLVLGFMYAVTPVKKTTRHLLLSGLLLGLSTWVRATEVFWFMGILTLLYQGWISQKRAIPIFAIVLLLLIRHGWTGYYAELIRALPEPPVASAPLSMKTLVQIYHNLPELKEYVIWYVFYPLWGTWMLACGLFVLSLRQKGIQVRLLVGVIFLSLLATLAGICLYSTFFATWFSIGDSVRRMLLFVPSLTIVAAVTALYELRSQHD